MTIKRTLWKDKIVNFLGVKFKFWCCLLLKGDDMLTLRVSITAALLHHLVFNWQKKKTNKQTTTRATGAAKRAGGKNRSSMNSNSESRIKGLKWKWPLRLIFRRRWRNIRQAWWRKGQVSKKGKNKAPKSASHVPEGCSEKYTTSFQGNTIKHTQTHFLCCLC